MTAEKKACAQSLVERGVDIASACKLANVSRASYYRPERDWRKRDAAVIDAINNELKRSPCSGLMEPDTLMRDNNRQPLRCQYESKAELQTIPERV